jgi:GT2 family glycosyltransferase
MKPVTLIILAWNRWALTRRCLETLRLTNLEDAEVLVVDNGSTDETPERLAELDWVRTLRLPENLGYVRGNNAGIDATAPDRDVVLLNNDLEFSDPEWLVKLRRAAASDPQVGVCGCRLVLPDGRLLHAGTFILPDTLWGQQIGSLETDVGQYASLRRVQGIVFAVAYLKRDMIDQIGGLSLDYESYFEDTDYCLSAAEHGWATAVAGDVTVVHAEHGSTTGDDSNFRRLFGTSRSVFEKKWKRKLIRHYRRNLLWQSIMNFPSGYARSSRDLVKALEQQGVRIIYRYVYGAGSPFPVEEPEGLGDYWLEVVRSRDLPCNIKTAVVYGQGDVFERNIGKRKIGFTMLEVDGFPAEWVRQANKMDEVWVPTEFNRRGMIDSGVKRPVHVVPLGVDPNYFHPGIEGHPNPYGDFVFLANFEWGERKEPWLLLRAFNETFRRDDPVRLVCKMINKDPGVRVKDEIAKLQLSERGGRIDYLFNIDFPHYQLGSLYRSADCFVSAGRGEGWDMPLMEAMACGLSSIATDWGAHEAFVTDEISYPLRVRGTVPAVAKCPYYVGFEWADPDPDHLRHLLRYVFEHQDEAAEKGRRAAATMVARWTWDQAAAKIVERLEVE